MTASTSFILTGGFNGDALKHSYHVDIMNQFGELMHSVSVYEMQEARYLHSMVYHNNIAYVIGGQSSPNDYLNSVEAFENNSWVLKPEMNKKRSFFTVIANNSAIWVAGGFSGSQEICQSIEKFHSGQWTLIEVTLPMYAGMCSVPRDTFNNCFYILGGSDGNKSSDRFLVFNTENSSFEEENLKLLYPRAGSSAFWIKEVFWIVGGGTPIGEMWDHGKVTETKTMSLSIYSQIEAASFIKSRD